MLVIETKQQLKKAQKEKVNEFIVVGELAKKMYKTRKISKLSKKAIIGLTLAFGLGAATLPFTGGLPALSAAAAITTIGGPTIIPTAISIGGFLFLYALHNDYNVDFTLSPDGTVKVKCKIK